MAKPNEGESMSFVRHQRLQMYSSILIVLYGLLVSLGAVAGTCTQGDVGRFYASIIYGSLLFLPIVIAIQRGRKYTTFIWISPLIALLVAILVTYFWIPLVIETTIEGHHLCGKVFDSHLGEIYLFERAIPMIHIVSSLAIFMLSLKKFVRLKKGK